jgi:HK97 family phage major capsid protein
MTANERALEATERELVRFANEIKDVWHKAEEDERETTPEERGEVEKKLKHIEQLKAQKAEIEDAIGVEEGVRDVAKGLGKTERIVSGGIEVEDGIDSVRGTFQVKTIGEQFVESEKFKSLLDQVKSGNGVPQHASTGPIEVKAGTLFETGQGAGLIPVPQVVGGQVETLFQRVTIADVLPSGQATSNSIRYVVEGTATSGAAAVAEGAAKPASDLALSTVDEPVQKIATILTVSDEMLEDVQAVQSYINSRLSLFVRIAEEDQLIRGNGTSPNISGFYDRAINVYGAGTVDDNAEALFKAINNTRGSSFLDVDHIFMHPDNWQATRLLQDSNGQFYGGGPFSATGAYGTGNMASANRLAMDSLWNVPVTITTAVGSGTALLGAFAQGAQLWRRGGLTVEATNSHDDYFIKNLVAIRAEQREALAVYRPSAFTKVTGLD